ncbi:hypothetical protein [Corynebacterium sp.]|uniref:hypothetical protein n=1 Tax=Corynebacterium sp. TaxID=1720 RepID=UPI002902D2C7|nr:hypothetical protein [Corynebacterium sp.]MDU3111031.1 hypothetical protein [Corynebacterium sp.]
MKKAALVLATSVAFFFGAMQAEAGRKYVTLPSSKSVANGAGTAVKETPYVHIPGEPGTEYIPRTPSGTKGTPVKVLPTLDYSIPRTINQAKNILKGNLGQILLQGTIAAAVAGVGWVMTDGAVVKKVIDAPAGAAKGKGYTRPAVLSHPVHYGLTMASACSPGTMKTGGSTTCILSNPAVSVTIVPTTCDSSTWFNPNTGLCDSLYEPTSHTEALTDSDFSQLDTFINAQGADWIKQLIRESCGGTYGGPNPDGCYQSLVESSKLSGPATVNGGTTQTLISGPTGITQQNKTTTYSIVYGDTYFDWTTNINNHQVNPDGTTQDSTETDDEKDEDPQAPALGDPYAPVVDKLKQISDDVSNPPQVPATVNYSPWYSFGGNCTNLNLNLPIYGAYTADICPYIYDWVRPVIAFLLALWTWHRCREMWSEALRIGRPI